MKKIKLDAAKLQLKKEKISSLTNEEMTKIVGGTAETTKCYSNFCPTVATCNKTRGCPYITVSCHC